MSVQTDHPAASVHTGLDASAVATASSVLDDLSAHAALDSAGMHEAVESLPDQLRQASTLAGQVDWRAFKPTTPAGVVVCGMGGSAIGGDLVRSFWEPESPVPMIVVRSDTLPAYINRFWMVIGSSYSGNTSETLAAIDEARRRGCTVLAVTSGGRLAEIATANRWPLIKVPVGLMPRAALGYSFGPTLMALSHWGITPDRAGSLQNSVHLLESMRNAYGRSQPLRRNPAKQAAAAINGRIALVYGLAGHSDVAALRLKCQLSENSKAVAFTNTIPELMHNEIVGVDSSHHPERLAAIILRLGEEAPETKRRIDWVAQRYRHRGIPVAEISASTGDRLMRLLSLVQIGDYISYHVAILTGQDPTPIPAIAALKVDLG